MSVHAGHRQRIIQKLDNSVLADHELLEVLLFNAIPRKDTNDLAHRLLMEFGSLSNLFSASMEELQRVDGVGASVASYLKIFGTILWKLVDQKESTYAGVFEPEKFFAFAKEKYEKEICEYFDVYFLDGDKNFKGMRRFTSEKIHTVSFATDDFARALVEKQPAGVVLVHNHPVGKAQPSIMDDETTERCQLICATHRVMLCDHIVYGKDGFFSYYLSGRLQKSAEKIFAVLGE